MSKPDKELAVELYSTYLSAVSNLLASPNFKTDVDLPSAEEMVEQVKIITEQLSTF